MHTLAHETIHINKSFWKYLIKFEQGGISQGLRELKMENILFPFLKKKKKKISKELLIILFIPVPGMEKAKRDYWEMRKNLKNGKNKECKLDAGAAKSFEINWKGYWEGRLKKKKG